MLACSLSEGKGAEREREKSYIGEKRGSIGGASFYIPIKESALCIIVNRGDAC
jgi:hypothetical protein